MTSKNDAPFRIAIRKGDIDGVSWVFFYLVPNDSMEGALELGRIRLRLCDDHPPLWESLRREMPRSVAVGMENACGIKTTEFIEQEPPEKEA